MTIIVAKNGDKKKNTSLLIPLYLYDWAKENRLSFSAILSEELEARYKEAKL